MALIRSSGSGGSPCGEPVIVGESLNNFLNSGLSSNELLLLCELLVLCELLPFFLSGLVSSDLDSKQKNQKKQKTFNEILVTENLF